MAPFTSEKITTIQSGHYHVLALTDHGHLWAWGCNNVGQLGVPVTTGPNPIPSLTPVPANITDISTFADYNLILERDPITKVVTVMAWGDNTYGQLGNGTASGWGMSVPQVITGTSSNPLTATPPPPTGLRVHFDYQVDAVGVVAWLTSPGARGYNVYHSTSPLGPWGSPINPKPLTSAYYADPAASQTNLVYYYAVTALEDATRESAQTVDSSLIDSTTYVSASVPASMPTTTGSRISLAQVTVVYHNYGLNSWSNGGYFLVPISSYNWNAPSVTPPANANGGTDVTFTFGIRAPTVAGDYVFQYQMIGPDNYIGYYYPSPKNVLLPERAFNFIL